MRSRRAVLNLIRFHRDSISLAVQKTTKRYTARLVVCLKMGEAPTQESSIPIGYEERHQGREASQITHYDPYARTAIPPLSPWTHVAIFTSILAPVALLPYLAVRRHLLSLHRQVSEIGAANAALQRDLRAALLESCIRREEHDRLGSTMNEIRRDLERVRAEQAAKDLQRARVEERTKSDIHELLEENKRMRYAHSLRAGLCNSYSPSGCTQDTPV